MKKAILLAILCAFLMTGCDDSENSEIIRQPEMLESVTASGEVSCEIIETCSDMIPPEVPEIFCTEEITEFSEIQEVIMTNEEIREDYEEGQELEITEIPEETAPEPTETEQFETTSCTTESVIQTEAMTETETVPETIESTEISETEPISEIETESEQGVTDFEKAKSVYQDMLENGHGTCVNYACQTYEKCLEIGLLCYIIWTDTGIYGHVANTVCVNEIWFILETQAECFLEFNYGFTEVVDEAGEHIADGEMLSNYSYQELFG
ncbi:MAG: hypothetical protein K2J71_02130 [Oscillospiraceae bacterium]|nr:hypothetical protein [Oscillospiraceae bacterium]